MKVFASRLMVPSRSSNGASYRSTVCIEATFFVVHRMCLGLCMHVVYCSIEKCIVLYFEKSNDALLNHSSNTALEQWSVLLFVINQVVCCCKWLWNKDLTCKRNPRFQVCMKGVWQAGSCCLLMNGR